MPRSSTSWWQRRGLLPTQVEQALGELAGAGSGHFRQLCRASRPDHAVEQAQAVEWSPAAAPDGAPRDRELPDGGRLLGSQTAGDPSGGSGRSWPPEPCSAATASSSSASSPARPSAPPWRELLMVYRRLEARGEIRGGRFVTGMSGRAIRSARSRGPAPLDPTAGGRRPAGRHQRSRSAQPDRASLLRETGFPPSPAIACSTGMACRSWLAKRDRSDRSWVSTEPTADLMHALVRKHSTAQLRSYLRNDRRSRCICSPQPSARQAAE